MVEILDNEKTLALQREHPPAVRQSQNWMIRSSASFYAPVPARHLKSNIDASPTASLVGMYPRYI